MLLILSQPKLAWDDKYRVQLELSLLACEFLHNALGVSWTAVTTMKTWANCCTPSSSLNTSWSLVPAQFLNSSCHCPNFQNRPIVITVVL